MEESGPKTNPKTTDKGNLSESPTADKTGSKEFKTQNNITPPLDDILNNGMDLGTKFKPKNNNLSNESCLDISKISNEGESFKINKDENNVSNSNNKESNESILCNLSPPPDPDLA